MAPVVKATPPGLPSAVCVQLSGVAFVPLAWLTPIDRESTTSETPGIPTTSPLTSVCSADQVRPLESLGVNSTSDRVPLSIWNPTPPAPTRSG